MYTVILMQTGLPQLMELRETQGILGNSKKLMETQGIFSFLENTQGNSWKFAVVVNNM